MFGDDAVAELFIEPEIAGQLRSNPNAYLRQAGAFRVVVGPAHQRPADTAPLPVGSDRDPADMEVTGLDLEPQATDRGPIHPGNGTPASFQIRPN